MALSLQEIRAKLLAKQELNNNNKNGGPNLDNSVYAFWNNPVGSTATIRYLPDGDETNDFFWRERMMIRIPFAGIKGHADGKQVDVTVPCVDMWKPNTCPIVAEIRPWWKDDNLKALARKYYRKKSWLFQGFVTNNPNKEDVPPENPIRRFIMTQQLYDIIHTALVSNDLDHLPTDYEHGRDFNLTKTLKKSPDGEHSNYTTSNWSMRTRVLNDDEMSAIQKYGLFNLNSFLPKKPDEAHLNAIMELFTASVNGELYDLERWGNYYKPAGFKADNNSSSNDDSDEVSSPMVPSAQISSAPSANSILSKLGNRTPETVSAPAKDVSEASTGSSKMQTPDDIIAAIRRRHQQK
jgi:hypothetical protein